MSDPRRSTARRARVVAWGAALAAGAACGAGDAPAAPPRSTQAVQAADPQYAPAALIARFRARVPDHPTAFGGATAATPESLGTRYVRALEHRDSAAIAPMALSASEFAWLYYLDAPLARPPYELDPDVMWTQITAQSGRGLARALQRYGGRPFGLTAVTCAPEARSGALRLHRCVAHAAGDSLAMGMVERGGRVKFVGFGNQL